MHSTCVYGEGVPGLQEEKAVLRARLLASRSALSAEERTGAARVIRDALLDRPEVQMAGTVAAYYSVGAEPDTRGLLYALWKRGSYVLLPVLRADGDLDWASYEGPDSLVPGPRGLLEPGEPPRGTEAVARADVVLVPALAVDRAGNRLGRGGGSYDRALARVGPLIPLIALVYDGELLDHVPAERHDVPVRAAVSPLTGITVLARGDTLLPRDPADPGEPPGVSRVSRPGPHGLGTPRALSRGRALVPGPRPCPGAAPLSRGLRPLSRGAPPLVPGGSAPCPGGLRPLSRGAPPLVPGPHPRIPSEETHPPDPCRFRTHHARPPGTPCGSRNPRAACAVMYA